MSRRLLFVCVVVMTVSSVTSAGVFSWFLSFPWIPPSTPNSQQQGAIVTTGQVGVQVGSGTSSGTNSGRYGNTQTSSSGTATQSVNVTGTQYTTVTGTGPGSQAVVFQTGSVALYQYQSF
jgi:hypothetical protein